MTNMASVQSVTEFTDKEIYEFYQHKPAIEIPEYILCRMIDYLRWTLLEKERARGHVEETYPF